MELTLTLQAIEERSKFLADSFSHLLGSMKSSLHAISAYSVQYEEVYMAATVDLCNQTDECVHHNELLIKKIQELDEILQQLTEVSTDIKELKKVVMLLH